MTARLRFIIISSSVLCFFVLQASTEQEVLKTQLIPDCDADFAELATGLIQSELDDVLKLQQIKAILSSCNKAMIQKQTEISLFLLRKGAVPTQMMENVRDLWEKMREEKDKSWNEMRRKTPTRLKPALDEIGSIYRNNSLSGNEKVIWASQQLLSFPEEDQRSLQMILSQERTISRGARPVDKGLQIKPLPVLNGTPIEAITKTTTTSTEEAEVVDQSRTSFGIKEESFSDHVLPTRPEPRMVGNTRVSSPNGNLPQPSNRLGETVGYRPSEQMSSNLMSKNSQPSQSTFHSGNFGEPVPATVLNHGKPRTVGGLKHSTEEISLSEMEDSDLLKTRSSIWAEAAKLLDKTTNLPNQIRRLIQQSSMRNGVLTGNPVQNGMQTFATSNTFPLPEEAYKKQNEDRDVLPTRLEDSVLPAIVPINRYPQNQFGALDRFQTNLGRFDKEGVANRVVLPGPPLEIPAVRRIEAKGAETFVQTEPSLGGNPNPKRFKQEYVTYAPPPMIVPTTTVSQDTWKKSPIPMTDSLSGGKFPYFPNLDMPSQPEFHPYLGPEEITGSHLQPRDISNNHQYKNRFVKIDLLNQ